MITVPIVMYGLFRYLFYWGTSVRMTMAKPLMCFTIPGLQWTIALWLLVVFIITAKANDKGCMRHEQSIVSFEELSVIFLPQW